MVIPSRTRALVRRTERAQVWCGCGLEHAHERRRANCNQLARPAGHPEGFYPAMGSNTSVEQASTRVHVCVLWCVQLESDLAARRAKAEEEGLEEDEEGEYDLRLVSFA